jgi:hypothetical protein
MSSRPATSITPVLRVTLYDWVCSWAISLFVGILVICSLVVTIFVSTREPKRPVAVPLELVELPGGFADGSPDETLRVDSPLPEVRDAAPVESNSDEMEIAEAVESVIEVSESASQQVQQQDQFQERQYDKTGIENKGKMGSAKGTGRRALGFGNGTGGMPREQRWFIKFGERVALDEYARQLQFFGIELGALLPDGRLADLSDLTAAAPQVRYVNSGASENRLYMTWQGGERRSADVQLFAKAHLEVHADTVIFHFYPKDTENMLAQLETTYRGRPVSQIRRTYFSVEPEGAKYRFTVYRQIYH